MGIFDRIFGGKDKKSAAHPIEAETKRTTTKKKKGVIKEAKGAHKCAKCGKKLGSAPQPSGGFGVVGNVGNAMLEGMTRPVPCGSCGATYCKACALEEGRDRPGDWHLICPGCGSDLGDIGMPF